MESITETKLKDLIVNSKVTGISFDLSKLVLVFNEGEYKLEISSFFEPLTLDLSTWNTVRVS